MAIESHNNGAHKPFTTQIVARGLFSGLVTLTGAVVLTAKSAQILKLDPGGSARNVTLPPAVDGLWFWVVNAADAAENLVILNPAGGTVCTINQNEEGIVASVGGAWALVRLATIALV